MGDLVSVKIPRNVAAWLDTTPHTDLAAATADGDDPRGRILLAVLREITAPPSTPRWHIHTDRAAIERHLQLLAHAEPQECIWVIALTAKLHVSAIDLVHRGTITTCPASPSDILRMAIRRGAASFIIAHNHPSGIIEVTQQDRVVTSMVKHAARAVDIRFDDHLIITSTGVCSLREQLPGLF